MHAILKYFGKYLALFLLFESNNIQAQTISPVMASARSVIDTLTSPLMYGRGYTSNGDKIAAAYIHDYFKKSKLLSWENNYYQPFAFPVNTFPSAKNKNSFFSLRFTFLDNQNKVCDKPGIDYIITSSSPGFELKENNLNNIVWVDSAALSTKDNYLALSNTHFSGKLILIDDRGITSNNSKIKLAQLHQNAVSAKGWIILNHTKLIASASTNVSAVPEIEVLLKEHVNRNDLKHINIEGNYTNDFEKSYTSKNICGYIPGKQYPDSFIVFTAHYDHLGEMGTIYFPGANDNASGTAMLLTLITHFSKPENKPAYSIAFIAFSGEEIGLLGSRFYTEHPLFPLNKIKFLINMDMLGTGEEGITVVNANEHQANFKKLTRINKENNYLTAIKARANAANSDHHFFSENGVPCFYIYSLGGIKAYHDVNDVSKTLSLAEFEDIAHLLIKFVE